MATQPIKTSDIIQENVLKNTIKEFETWSKIVIKLEKDLLDLAKVTKNDLFNVDSKDIKSVKELGNSISNLDAKTKLLNTSRESQKRVLTDLEKAQLKLKQAQTDEAKRLALTKLRIQEVNKANREQAKNQIKLLSPYKQASKNLNILRNRYKDLATQNKQNTKEGQRLLKNITRLDTKLKQIDKTVGQSQRNVGNYSEAIGDAVRETGLFGRELAILQTIQRTVNKLLKINTGEQKANTLATTTSAKATKSLTLAQKGLAVATKLSSKALKGFKIALASTGIGAVIVVLGSLFTFLTRTQGGIDKLEQATTALSTTFDVLIDRVSGTGEAFSLLFSGEFTKAFDKFKESFSGIGDEIDRENKLANESIKIQQGLRIEFAQFITERSIGERKISRLRLEARDEENTDLQSKLSGLQEAFLLEETITEKSIRLRKSLLAQSLVGGESAKTQAESEQLINDVLEGRTKLNIDNLGLANSTVQDLEDANNQVAEINKEIEGQFNNQRSLLREIERLKNLISKGDKEQIKKEKETTGLINKQRELVSKLKKEKDSLNDEDLIVIKQSEIENAITELKRLESLGVTIKVTDDTEERIKNANEKIKQALLDRKADQLKVQGETLSETLKNIDDKEKAEIDAINNRFETELKAEGLLDEEIKEIKQRQQFEIEDTINKNKDLRNNANQEDIDRIKDLDDEKLESFKELQQSLTEALGNALDSRFDLIQANLDKELDASKKQQDRLQDLADKGSADALESLQAEREKEQKLEEEKLKQERKQANIKKGIEVYKILASNDGDVGKTISDVAILEALIKSLPTAYDGMEDTGSGGNLDSKGGFLSVLHPNEAVVKASTNKKKLKAGLTNEQAVEYAIKYQHLKPKINDKVEVKNDNSELKDIRNILKDLPNNMPTQDLFFDEQEKAYVRIIKQNGKVNRIHTRSKGLFR